MRHFIGIDPGAKGEVAIITELSERTDVAVIDMPTMKIGGKTAVDAHRLSEHLGKLRKEEVELCVVEDVHSMPGQGVVSAFSFGRNFGTAQQIYAGTLTSSPGLPD